MAQGSLSRGIVLLALMGACAAPPAKAPPPATTAPSPVPRAPTPAPPPQVNLAPATPKDACGAEPLQYLVGKSRTEIPPPLAPNRRRVVCSTCAVTQDYAPYRQTITYDAATGLVTSVKCG